MKSTKIKLKMSAEEILTFRLSIEATKEDLADLLGVSVSSVYQWESGEKQMSPSTVKVIRLLARRPELLNEY